MLVTVYNGDVNKALKILKKRMQSELKLYKDRQRFEKPSAKRRRKRAAAVLRGKREAAKNAEW